MLDDPRVNFAISTRSGQAGLDHLGIQVETQNELQEVYGRLQQADQPVLEEGVTTCCYAKSEKAWIKDPQGLSWETFLTLGESTSTGITSISIPSAKHRSVLRACGRYRAGRCRLLLPKTRDGGMTERAFNILFLCIGNSASA